MGLTGAQHARHQTNYVSTDDRAPAFLKRVLFFLLIHSLSKIASGFGVLQSFGTLQISTRQCQLVQPETALNNIYDDWRSDAVVDTKYLSEENILFCLDEFVNSDYGKQMFGCHDQPSSIGITGAIDFVDLAGPEVVLRLSGKFWHKRDTVLGRAAMWLNARMPEIVEVRVESPEELKDYEDIVDEYTREVLYREDKRSPDFNGDREVMEYQGRDPDMRGPFPQGVGGFRPGGSMIDPS